MSDLAVVALIACYLGAILAAAKICDDEFVAGLIAFMGAFPVLIAIFAVAGI